MEGGNCAEQGAIFDEQLIKNTLPEDYSVVVVLNY